MIDDVVLAYLERLRGMTDSPRLLGHIDEAEADRREELARRVSDIDDSDICDECQQRHASTACPCHCGEPVDTSEYRNRGMCTHCDDVRCDVYGGDCGQ